MDRVARSGLVSLKSATFIQDEDGATVDQRTLQIYHLIYSDIYILHLYLL